MLPADLPVAPRLPVAIASAARAARALRARKYRGAYYVLTPRGQALLSALDAMQGGHQLGFQTPQDAA